MSQRTQWIILGVLLGLLAIVAVVTLRSREQSGAAASPPPETGAPGGAAQAAPSPENEFRGCGQAQHPARMVQRKEHSVPVRKISGRHRQLRRAAAPGGSRREESRRPRFKGPSGSTASAMALFEGEAFATDEKIRGTAYTVTTVEPESVSVKGADGKVITLKLSE